MRSKMNIEYVELTDAEQVDEASMCLTAIEMEIAAMAEKNYLIP